MCRVRADEHVLAVEVALGHVLQQARPETVVVLLGDRVVHVAPPDLRLGGRLDDDELVLWRAPGVLAGPDDERAVRGEDALALVEGELVQLGGGEVGPAGSRQAAG